MERPVRSFPYQLNCVRCGAPLEIDTGPGAGVRTELFEGCPRCADQGTPANFTVRFDTAAAAAREAAGRPGGDPRPGGDLWDERDRSQWRYGALLPVGRAHRLSLGEGQTPLLRLERFGRRIGVPELYVKDESQNPTWSYKDRLGSVAVAKGRELGARVVTASSTGNHGAAAAAYAARAGLPCVIFTTPTVPDVMKTLMQAYGALVVAAPTMQDRFRLMAEGVREHGWYAVSGYRYPPIGSNPFGVEAYKVIAFETWEQLGRVPDWVSVPTCYGDGLYGTWKGWRELRELGMTAGAPRMIAAEVYGSLEAAVRTGQPHPPELPTAPTPAFSIATPVGTQQSLAALRESQGIACGTHDENLIELQKQLAADEGLFAEASAVVPLAAAARLRREGKLNEQATVVAVLSSSALKDPGATARELPPVPAVEPTMAAVARALRETYRADVL